MSRILDGILDGCRSKIEEAVFELDSPNHMGNVTATPEYCLTMVERAEKASSDFLAGFVGLVQVCPSIGGTSHKGYSPHLVSKSRAASIRTPSTLQTT